MRLILCNLAAASIFWVANGQAQAQPSCGNNDRTLDQVDDTSLATFVAEKLSAGHYNCVADVLRVKSMARSSLPGLHGWDMRFALREFTLDTIANTVLPATERVKLLQAAAGASLGSAATRNKEDLQADARMMMLSLPLLAPNCAAEYSALSLAARIDRQVPKADRDASIEGYEPKLCYVLDPGSGGEKTYSGVEELLQLEELIRGDSQLAGWRYSVAFALEFPQGGGYSVDPDLKLRQAHQILQLTDALGDIQMCPRGFCDEWRWWPLWSVAGVFYRLNAPEATATQERVLRLVGNMPDQEGKLRALQSICVGMQYAHYRELENHYTELEYQPLLDELTPLAQLLTSELALRLRNTLPQKKCL